MYTCVSCNIGKQDAPLMRCFHCGKYAIDYYYSYESGIVILDLILCKVQAYRHILKNRYVDVIQLYQNAQQQLSNNYKCAIGVGILFFYIVLELFYKYQGSIFKKDPFELDYNEVLKHVAKVGLIIFFQITVVLSCIVLLYSQKVKQLLKQVKSVSLVQIVFGLILAHFARLSIILFVIWGHSLFFKQMASISIKLAEISTIRALFEQYDNWIQAAITVIASIGIQTIISNYMLGINNINIL